MGISIGLAGLGSFGSCFAPLFKNHPLVDRVGFCDREPEILKRFAQDPFYQEKCGSRDFFGSLEEICAADYDALVIITQPWLHAPQCIQALESGKHVYSAVPIISLPDNGEILQWCDRLVDAVERTGHHYMLGETTYFRPQAMYCRRRAREGAFGDFVYAEGEYTHDVDSGCNLRQVQHQRTSSSSGREWLEIKQRYARLRKLTSPMHYPTHSTCGPVAVMSAHAVKVNAFGFANRNGDPFFEDHAFSNTAALFQMSNGAAVRILEAREMPGKVGAEDEAFRVFGTRGSFSENRWFATGRPDFKELDLENLPQPDFQKLTPADMFDPLPEPVEAAFREVLFKEEPEENRLSSDFSATGHGGSHPYLVHEFVEAVAQARRPAIHVYEAVRYMAMGVAAHESALRNGETVNVTDWGDPPGS